MAGVEVRGGVTERRGIAAADVSADATQAQVHPRAANLEALLAAARTRRHVADHAGVFAFQRHGGTPLAAGVSVARMERSAIRDLRGRSRLTSFEASGLRRGTARSFKKSFTQGGCNDDDQDICGQDTCGWLSHHLC